MTTFEDIIAADTILQRVVAQTSAPKPSRRGNDLYFTLCDSIVSQQISTKAAAVIFGRFCALFPEGYPAADLVLQKTDEELRAASLSFQKINYLRNVARFHLESGIDNDRLDAMTDDEIIAWRPTGARRIRLPVSEDRIRGRRAATGVSTPYTDP